MLERMQRSVLECAGLAAFAIASTAVLWARFDAPPGGGSTFPYDLVFYFVPMLERVSARLAAGELPLWDPAACSGIPLFATLQVATLYPTTWLGIVLAPERAIPAALVAHLAGGALGAALFFRHAGAHLPAAAMGSLVYTFACVLGLSFWPPSLVTVAWMPWMLLFAEMLLTSFRWRI